MAQHRDYFKDQMDQMGRLLGMLLADILGLKRDGNISEMNSLVQKTFTKDIGFDFEEVKNTSPGQLVYFLTEEKQFSDVHIQHVANILFELGMEAETKSEREILYSRANVLYEYLNTVGTTFSFDFLLKMNRIKEELE
ncbi:MAG TPA: hypothetical protein VGF30_10130 [Bacteroidia bacterium]